MIDVRNPAASFAGLVDAVTQPALGLWHLHLKYQGMPLDVRDDATPDHDALVKLRTGAPILGFVDAKRTVVLWITHDEWREVPAKTCPHDAQGLLTWTVEDLRLPSAWCRRCGGLRTDNGLWMLADLPRLVNR